MLLQRFKIHFHHKALFSYLYKINILLILALMVLIAGLFFISDSFAAGFSLNTSIPRKAYNIPSGNLGKALATYSAQAGVVLVFDPLLTEGKQSPGLKGEYGLNEGFSTLLKGSGLEVAGDGNGEYSLKRAKVVVDDSKNLPEEISLKEIAVRAQRFYEVGPLPGLGLTLEQIPGNVQSISAKDIKEAHSLSITDLMNRKLQSVNVNDYQGNPFQMDVTYRGFTAGPQIGTPQGLSVFLDGIRVNEPFGDVVNWDMIPMNALAGVDVFPGSNPIFGLNTLGGAFSMKTKDGFNNTGVDADILTGSFGRKQLQVSGGWNNGTVGLFGAGNFFLEDGWRVNSPSKVNQVFGKASYRGEKLDLNLSTLLVQTDLVGNGLVPSQMYEQNRDSTFTSEDTTKNTLAQLQLSSSYFVSDTFTITGQIYRRNSKRKALGADAYMDGYGQEQNVKRNLAAGEQYTCQYLSTNKYGIPDYYVVDIPDPNDNFSSPFIADYFANGVPDFTLLPSQYAPGDPRYVAGDLAKNAELTSEYASGAKYSFEYYKNILNEVLFANSPPPELGPVLANGDNQYRFPTFGEWLNPKGYANDVDAIEVFGNYFYTPDGVKHAVLTISPLNKAVCDGVSNLDVLDANGKVFAPDGAGTNSAGVVEGTPTSVLTDNSINQVVDGGSLQLNWNWDKHKFMVGSSVDIARADYSNTQRLGLLDENRKAYLSPEGIRDEYAAADVDISNNDFKGTSTTQSIYASETWSPIETLHFTGSARYNQTHVKNQVATRTAFNFFDLAQYRAAPDSFDICTGSADNCPAQGYKPGNGSLLLNPAETEKFSYYSLNPSLGASWQATKSLNVYGNWSQGTRTPSVIELGCAFDSRPSGSFVFDASGKLVPVPRSLAENRSCTLPTTLSGDPYLPQIKAQTFDLGMRGTWGDKIKWNLGAYRTDLKDDVYLVSVGAASSYFDSIGQTRRQGIEAGFSGELDKVRFGMNYALTDATFQDTFDMVNENNSSSIQVPRTSVSDPFRYITVKPGNRMPGVPLHNLNARISYDVTDKWTVGLNAVMHSESFVRGNENNQHQEGVTQFVQVTIPDGAGGFQVVNQPRQPFNNPGKVAGYTVFNFQTSYKLSAEWTATLLINNVFDREYFSAGRLGRNPFSPSINGAIGPGGYNYNSNDWLATNFIAPGAPRGIWFSLNYQFDVRK